LIPGLLSLITGKSVSLEDLAAKIHVNPALLELCIKLSTFAKSEAKLDKKISELKTSPTLRIAWDFIRAKPEFVEMLVRLSFNKVHLEDVEEMLEKLGLKPLVNLELISSFFAIAAGLYYEPTDRSAILFKDSPVRESMHTQLAKYLRPVCTKFLNMDYEMAVMAIRLWQGDFYIFDDNRSLIDPFLPNETLRRTCMACCGLLTLPIKYKQQLYKYPKDFEYPLSFEGAANLLCNTLNINPIILRLVTFDPATYDTIRDKHGFPKSAVGNSPKVMIALVDHGQFRLHVHLHCKTSDAQRVV
jgi:hypothetical protein